ncbi:hypothetical protein [Dawidia soli]|uniref:Uncharacterized protein n=1 Tax=Dawidia soli TaxID=2782352 RepID=A0AAP2DE14_9BACT|nr:hypothetical protein [Dawidia soli]MBT1689441.1 hypothetical protein [Dawidia soli]
MNLQIGTGKSRTLNKKNIGDAISSYFRLLDSVSLSISATNVHSFLLGLKRETIKAGPYPNVSIFEAANRIMTDLTILYGVQALLNGVLEAVRFDEYEVLFGNENHNAFDVMARNERNKLIGEAFNVATSFFPGKKAASMKKLRASKDSDVIILLLYNADAVSDTYKPKKENNVFHLPVHIPF